MKYSDRVYGQFNITEPVILELINCPAIQRLKKIDQAGYKPLWAKPETRVNGTEASRFAHSVGVFILLNKYQAPLEEQIAGLIHDVSHSAFSHCIDYVLDSGSEKEHTHQDRLFPSFVRKSGIPKILEKYGFALDYILDDGNFPLKEKELPDLCADRIDYSLREAVIYNELGEKDRNYLLDSLTVKDNYWVFSSFESGKKYAELFFQLNTIYFSGLPSAVMFRAVGDCLKYALKVGYLSENDLYTTDEKVLGKIRNKVDSDGKLSVLWDRMNGVIKAHNDPSDYESTVFCKSRIVDPLFLNGTKVQRLSETKPEWKKVVERESKPKQYFLKFER
ncbi:MAG: hypothetical protein AAB486_02245 [Patescibacteria group bacterium]